MASVPTGYNSNPIMRAEKIQKQYDRIRSQCSIVTACDSKHAPYLFNAIASFDHRFTDRPQIIVYDIGLSRLQRHELQKKAGLEIRTVPSFVPHWRLNWSWKLYVLSNFSARYVLYLDLPNFVILRTLAPWFVSIAKRGYLVVANGQTLGQITPDEYWSRYGLQAEVMRRKPTFGAGIIGFDREGVAFEAIELAFRGTEQGLNLGRSVDEKNKNYQPNIIRECPCFRADQTLINLAFRAVFKLDLQVRRAALYCGQGGVNDHPSQYLWYARRNNVSLSYLFSAGRKFDVVYISNRLHWAAKLSTIVMLKAALRVVKLLRA